MTDTVATLPKDRGGVIHLGEKGEAYKFQNAPYWEMKRKPTRLKNGDKFFICTEGWLRGFFYVDDQYWEGMIDEEEAQELIKDKMEIYYLVDFIPESWTPIIPIPMRGFQGFRYRISEKGGIRFNYIDVHELLSWHPEDTNTEIYLSWNYFKYDTQFYEDLGRLNRSKWWN